jgi:putative ABC transport system substrate-binding protein
MTTRREVIAGLGAAAAWPVVARGQRAGMPTIGFLSAGSSNGAADELRAIQQGLAELGFVEGRNFAVDYRWADGRNDRLPDLAAELVGRGVNVIVTGGSIDAARAAATATSMIPIVFDLASDPVRAGLVSSLGKPGANRTGVTTLTVELLPKRLELLHEVVPDRDTISVLMNPRSAISSPSKDMQDAARALGLRLEALYAETEAEIDRALGSFSEPARHALMIAPDPFFLDRRAQIGALTLRHALPAIYSYREFVAAGGLMSYGGSRAEVGHQVGTYVGRILKGERASDLAVYQTTKVVLTINLETAKALGITVPISLLGRADEVIE